MPVDQWGNVIFADELTKSGIKQNEEERDRKRQGEFANYLKIKVWLRAKVCSEHGTEFNHSKVWWIEGYQRNRLPSSKVSH